MDRYMRDEIAEALQSFRIRPTGTMSNVVKDLETKIGDNSDLAISLLERVKKIHDAYTPALSLGFANLPVPLLVIVRMQGKISI